MKYINLGLKVKDLTNEKKILEELINGSCLQGSVEIDYKTLVDMFGQPNLGLSEDRKVECEWTILTTSGIATIYNYKSGIHYSEEGLPKEKITDWHIGGHNKIVANIIKQVITKD